MTETQIANQPQKRVVVVILTWNGINHLQTFLPSVIAYSSHIADVVVIDNGSTDQSVHLLKTQFPSVGVIELGHNYGFTGGYNRAMALIEHEFAIILNSDVAVTENWIEPLIDLFDTDANIAAAQPKINAHRDKHLFEYAGAGGGFIDFLGYPFCRGRLFDSIEADNGQYDDIREIFWATGACMFVRTKLFQTEGGFDDDFFAHNEEIDLCWRLKNKGFSIYYCGLSQVYHLGGGTLSKANPHKTFLNFRNNLTMLIKNDRSGLLFSKFVIRLLLDGVAGLKFMLQGNIADMWAVVRAHFAVYGSLLTILNKRKKLGRDYIKPKGILLKSIVFEHYIKGKKVIDTSQL